MRSKNLVKLLGVVVLLVPVLLSAQNLPCRTYGGTMNERAHALVQSADDYSYVMAGFTTMPLDTNLLIVKIDSFGDTLKAKISYGLKTEIATSMIRTSDNGYALTGWTKSYQPPNAAGSMKANIFVIKLDVNLIVQWGFVYSTYGDYEERAYSIIETFSTGPGYAVVGWTEFSGFNPSPALFILKLLPNGYQQWLKIYNRRTFGEMGWVNAPTEGYDIVEIHMMPPYFLAGGFAITGRSINPMMANQDAFLMCVDNNGLIVMQFCKSLLGMYEDEGYSIILDGMDLVVAGWTNSYGPGTGTFGAPANIFVWKTSLMTGQDAYIKVYGWADGDEKVMDEQSLIRTSDVMYALSGWTCSQGPGAPPNPNFLIMKLASVDGSILWSRVHPSIPVAGSEQAYPIIETFNAGIPKGFAIAGWTNNFGVGPQGTEDFHFLTLDPAGNRPVCVLSITPDTSRCWSYMDSAVLFTEGFDTTRIPLKDTSVMYTKICTTEVHVDTIDVGPTKIFFSSASPFDSTITSTIIPSCSLYNYGNTDVSGYNVQMTIGNFYTGTYTVGSHLAHTYIQADFPTSVTDWPRGLHAVKCTTQLTGDRDENNNLAITTIFVNVHDVGTVEINYPTGNVDSVATFTPQAKVRNYGNVSDNFNVKFTIDGPAKSTWTDDTMVTVNANSEQTIDFADWDVGPAGNYTTKCSTELNTDMDGSNDEKDSSFTVVGALTHNVGTVEIYMPTAGNIDSIATITPQAKIKNYGSNTDTFNVKFTIKELAKATWFDDTTIILNSLEELTIDFEDWTVGPKGDYVAKCSTELDGDEFHNNDKEEVSFTIQVSPPPTPGWAQKESIVTPQPAKMIKDGGALVGVQDTGKDPSKLYAFLGTKTNRFRKYTVGIGWTDAETLLFGHKYKFGIGMDTVKFNKKFPGKGAALCYDGTSKIYATKGNGTHEFYAYDILTGIWTPKAFVPTPKPLKGGTSIRYFDGKVYLLAGGQKKDPLVDNFWMYDPLGDTTNGTPWTALGKLPLGPNTKVWKDGASIIEVNNTFYAVKSSDKTNLFYAYDWATSTWLQKEDMPIDDSSYHRYKKKLIVKDGAATATDGTIIYATKGGGTEPFWKYTPGTPGVWERLDRIPIEKIDKKHAPKTGAAMAYVDGKVWLLVGNKQVDFWCYTPSIEISNIKYQKSNINTQTENSEIKTHSSQLNITPNPFTKLTIIHYTVPIFGKVAIKLYNASGRLIETLVNDNLNAGTYTTKLSTKNLANGIYFVKYESNTTKNEIKLVVQ